MKRRYWIVIVVVLSGAVVGKGFAEDAPSNGSARVSPSRSSIRGREKLLKSEGAGIPSNASAVGPTRPGETAKEPAIGDRTNTPALPRVIPRGGLKPKPKLKGPIQAQPQKMKPLGIEPGPGQAKKEASSLAPTHLTPPADPLKDGGEMLHRLAAPVGKQMEMDRVAAAHAEPPRFVPASVASGPKPLLLGQGLHPTPGHHSPNPAIVDGRTYTNNQGAAALDGAPAFRTH